MFSEENSVKIGKIGKIFGLNGELTLRLYDAFPDEIDYKEPIFVYLNGLLVPLFIKSFIRKGINKAVVVFDDIDTQYRAQEFVGIDIIAFSDETEVVEITNDDELYLENIIGYQFSDTTSQRTGKITDFIDSTLNPLFVVENNGEEFYIPANDEIIVEINVSDKQIILSLPDGVFDINN